MAPSTASSSSTPQQILEGVLDRFASSPIRSTHEPAPRDDNEGEDEQHGREERGLLPQEDEDARARAASRTSPTTTGITAIGGGGGGGSSTTSRRNHHRSSPSSSSNGGGEFVFPCLVVPPGSSSETTPPPRTRSGSNDGKAEEQESTVAVVPDLVGPDGELRRDLPEILSRPLATPLKPLLDHASSSKNTSRGNNKNGGGSHLGQAMHELFHHLIQQRIENWMALLENAIESSEKNNKAKAKNAADDQPSSPGSSNSDGTNHARVLAALQNVQESIQVENSNNRIQIKFRVSQPHECTDNTDDVRDNKEHFYAAVEQELAQLAAEAITSMKCPNSPGASLMGGSGSQNNSPPKSPRSPVVSSNQQEEHPSVMSKKILSPKILSPRRNPNPPPPESESGGGDASMTNINNTNNDNGVGGGTYRDVTLDLAMEATASVLAQIGPDLDQQQTVMFVTHGKITGRFHRDPQPPSTTSTRSSTRTNKTTTTRTHKIVTRNSSRKKNAAAAAASEDHQVPQQPPLTLCDVELTLNTEELLSSMIRQARSVARSAAESVILNAAADEELLSAGAESSGSEGTASVTTSSSTEESSFLETSASEDSNEELVTASTTTPAATTASYPWVTTPSSRVAQDVYNLVSPAASSTGACSLMPSGKFFLPSRSLSSTSGGGASLALSFKSPPPPSTSVGGGAGNDGGDCGPPLAPALVSPLDRIGAAIGGAKLPLKRGTSSSSASADMTMTMRSSMYPPPKRTRSAMQEEAAAEGGHGGTDAGPFLPTLGGEGRHHQGGGGSLADVAGALTSLKHHPSSSSPTSQLRAQ